MILVTGGAGCSVFKIVNAAQHICDREIPRRISCCRMENPSEILDRSARARFELDWIQFASDRDFFLSRAWELSQSHSQGYPEEIDIL